jgi:hypothetical protein
MQEMGSQMQYADKKGVSDRTLANTQHELHMLKTTMNSDYAHLDKQISSVRASVVQLEGSLAVLSADVKLALQKSDHIHSEFDRNLQDWRRDVKRRSAGLADVTDIDALR